MPTKYSNHKLECFMRESNAIEGEFEHPYRSDHICTHGTLNPGDMAAIEFALCTENFDYHTICGLHGIVCGHRNDIAVGTIRKCPVRVGEWLAPNPGMVRRLLMQFADDFPELDSFDAHNRFEKIHPFEDGNGRVGRLLWLSKAVKEGYNFSLSFLQEYYYQTLRHCEVKNRNMVTT